MSIVKIPGSYVVRQMEMVQCNGVIYEVPIDLSGNPNWSVMANWITNQATINQLQTIWPVYLSDKRRYQQYVDSGTAQRRQYERMKLLRRRAQSSYNGLQAFLSND